MSSAKVSWSRAIFAILKMNLSSSEFWGMFSEYCLMDIFRALLVNEELSFNPNLCDLLTASFHCVAFLRLNSGLFSWSHGNSSTCCSEEFNDKFRDPKKFEMSATEICSDKFCPIHILGMYERDTAFGSRIWLNSIFLLICPIILHLNLGFWFWVSLISFCPKISAPDWTFAPIFAPVPVHPWFSIVTISSPLHDSISWRETGVFPARVNRAGVDLDSEKTYTFGRQLYCPLYFKSSNQIKSPWLKRWIVIWLISWIRKFFDCIFWTAVSSLALTWCTFGLRCK